jgi:hypothetical protein
LRIAEFRGIHAHPAAIDELPTPPQGKEPGMPRRAARPSAEDVILEAVEAVVARAAVGISRAIAEVLSVRLDEELKRQVSKAIGRRGRGGGKAKGARPRDISRWTADRRARRVPNFVIEQTGLKTKKQVVAKYGEDAAFEKGKAPPKAK